MDFKVVEQIRKAPSDSKGRIALVAIQELIKSTKGYILGHSLHWITITHSYWKMDSHQQN